jgi:hypothetical protein
MTEHLGDLIWLPGILLFALSAGALNPDNH